MNNRDRSEFAVVSTTWDGSKITVFSREEKLNFLVGVMKERSAGMGKVIPLRTDPYSRFLDHGDDVKFFFEHVREDTDFVAKIGTILRSPYAANLVQQIEELYKKTKKD
jgi:hypothetical protein